MSNKLKRTLEEKKIQRFYLNEYERNMIREWGILLQFHQYKTQMIHQFIAYVAKERGMLVKDGYEPMFEIDTKDDSVIMREIKGIDNKDKE